MSILEKTIDSVLGNVDEILQNFKYKKKYLDKIEEDMNKIDIEMKNSLSNMSQYISNNFKELKDEFIKILGMIVKKVENNEEFDLTYKSNKLFKGYNGLTTNYIMFHKKV